MTVKELREKLEAVVEELEELEEDFGADKEVSMESNTYFIRSHEFIGLRDGFIDLRNLVDEDEDEDEDEEDW